MKYILMDAVLCLLLCVAFRGSAQNGQATVDRAEGMKMKVRISGKFDAKLTPQAPHGDGADGGLGSMLIEKKFHGDLEAVSKGQMISEVTSTKGSAGYVAMERVDGTLQGRKGMFVLQHSGTMNRGKSQLTVTVVPDSGTEQLKGLAGSMSIRIEGGTHFYDFEYTISPGIL